MANVVADQSTNVIEIVDLIDQVTKLPIPTSATVTITLKDSTGADVTGAVGVPLGWEPATTLAVAAWRGRIPATVTLNDPKKKYTGIVVAITGSKKRTFKPTIDLE
jgi:hypothetical protein